MGRTKQATGGSQRSVNIEDFTDVFGVDLKGYFEALDNMRKERLPEPQDNANCPLCPHKKKNTEDQHQQR